MIYESEWDGFVMQSQSGIAEALYAAGVDCTVRSQGEPDPVDDALFAPDHVPQRTGDMERNPHGAASH